MKNLLTIFSVFIFSLFVNIAFSQTTIEAVKTTEKISIDGFLNEKTWKTNLQIASKFKTRAPVPGQDVKYDTYVKILFDDEALYVSGFMKDISRDSVMRELAERDNIGNSDFFGFYLDTYGNSNEAFEFIVSAAGGQFDARLTPYNEDRNWDAVWESAISLSDDGWYAEMKIPYSAIRFSKEDKYEWKINFFRNKRTNGEQSNWVEVKPNLDNRFLTQMGTLVGVKDITPPLRLSFSPYASIYGVHTRDESQSPINQAGTSYNLGMDLKYGITDAFTLDMTLIPDFGQVQSDDAVLNLSPFEIQFDENRAFFTEGLNLFGKADIFYSRRVGDGQQLYNATKISGRTKNGLGIGFFNAIAAEDTEKNYNIETKLEIDSIIAPLSNYNILVFDKDLKNNSSFSLINTNVLRRGAKFHSANVTATEYNIKNKEQTYGVSGIAAFSQIINKEEANQNGHSFEIELERLKGKFTYGVEYAEISKDYDHNDLGFLQNSNVRRTGIYSEYNKPDGLWKFLDFEYWINYNYHRLVDPNVFTYHHVNTGFWAQAKNFWEFNVWSNYQSNRSDYFEPRVEGRFFQKPSFGNLGYWVGTDYRKKLQLQYYGFGYQYSIDEWKGFEQGVSIRYRFSNKLTATLDARITKHNNAIGYVDNPSDNEIYFGKRNQSIVSNVLYASYKFTSNMSLEFRGRHYWSKVHYKKFFDLGVDGSLVESRYNEHNDFSFGVFNIDLNYRWRFAPGSDIFIVWKNNISGVHSDETTNFEDLNYNNGIRRLGDFPQNNSLSLRVVYFLDYSQTIKKWI